MHCAGGAEWERAPVAAQEGVTAAHGVKMNGGGRRCQGVRQGMEAPNFNIQALGEKLQISNTQQQLERW